MSKYSYGIFVTWALFILPLIHLKICSAVSLKLRLPVEIVATTTSGTFRVDYSPAHGNPSPNFTLNPVDIIDDLPISDVIPGTEYTFHLYYTNSSLSEWKAWTTSIPTSPYPPTNLTIDVQSRTTATIFWQPPTNGGYTGIKLSVSSLFMKDSSFPRNVYISQPPPFILHDLTPGATYDVRLHSVFLGQESSNFTSANFTTVPNAPGRFIVWFRNETTLLVLWQPPYPLGIFDQYCVSILPQDATESVKYVKSENEHREQPGPVRVAFNGLVPGRGYNISVQTVSRNQISKPTEAQYRTVPLSPNNLTYDKDTLTSYSFRVQWSPPKSLSEFDRYQVGFQNQHSKRQIIDKDDERIASFENGVEPGHTYEIAVKALSGTVASWPLVINVTTRPLPVKELNASSITVDEFEVEWTADNSSVQDSFLVKYNELEAFSSESIPRVVHDTNIKLSALLPGRNYSISVEAASNDILSEPVIIFRTTKPASPVIEILEPSQVGWNISWKSDVTSRQDLFYVTYVRNDTKENVEKATTNNWLILENLYPGASYEIKVYAVSYGISSDPHLHFQTVYPNPPTDLQVVNVANTEMSLKWNLPTESLYDHFMIRYKTAASKIWDPKTGNTNTTSYEIKNLIPGETYKVEVASVSNSIESSEIKEIEQTMYPGAIQEVNHTLDSHNITFQWKVPYGHRDYYIIRYNAVKSSKKETQQIPANSTQYKSTMSVTIDNLKPGALYVFQFFAVSQNLESEGIGIQVRTMPVIDSVISIVAEQHTTRSLGIKYTPTLKRNVEFDRYRFQLSDPQVLVQEKLENDEDRLVIFDNLQPGHLYNITIWTVSDGVKSVPIHRQARISPEPITKITASSLTDTEITLQWDIPEGDKDGYEVEYKDHLGHLVKNITSRPQISYSRLKPHHNYSFLVTVLSGYETTTPSRSLLVSQTFQTLESVPGRVNFTVEKITPSDITFQWTLPQNEQNGIITGFKVTYYINGSSTQNYKTFKPDETVGMISNLKPGNVYIFEIEAHTKVGSGSKSKVSKATPIWSPPKPLESVVPIVISYTSTTIRVKYKNNFFSSINGDIIYYTLIVTEDNTKVPHLKLPSWSDVQDYPSWPPYQVTDPYYPFNDTLEEDFTIGMEKCKGIRGYCNGALKPGSTYRVKVRAFTSSEQYADTEYSKSIQTEPDNTTLIISILLPLSLLLLVAIILLVLRQRRVGPFTRKSSSRRGKDDALSIPESEIITSRPVKLKDFAEHYRIMSADSDFRFSEEFELLKHVGRDKPCTAADLPVNRPKNRFTNILPYDHSRIKLLPTDDEEGSDYVNANYIPGFNSPREFIVTQGPLHSTRDDLWRMVWEQNCRAIVMLTRCIEKGREKCDHYWPFDTQLVYYGDIQVTILNESQYTHWTISEFKVCRGDQSRIVRHFHFTTWPDFGVPDPPQTLVKFVRAFREMIVPDQKPVVVHCSAGVGRSGTFIALDHLLQHIQKYDYVDIFKIVHDMRKERVWMVQNEQQYICIHQCLLCVLEKKEDILDFPRPEAHDNQGYEDDEGIAESGI